MLIYRVENEPHNVKQENKRVKECILRNGEIQFTKKVICT